MQLHGLHHLTAITARASDNVRFFTEALGLRLVKKTVNQDDVSAYHLFYGDEVGSPGTEITFFDWQHMPPTTFGTGLISQTALRVNGREALEWWLRRFDELGIEHQGLGQIAGRDAIPFVDMEGQRLALVDDGGAPAGKPWTNGPIPENMAIRGMASVRITVPSVDQTEPFLTDIMNFTRGETYSSPESESGTLTVFDIEGGGPGAELHVEERPDLPRGQAGAGGVHHVAFRVSDDEEHKQALQYLRSKGIGTTDLIDRFYFKALYFQTPDGILFEISTDGPGFATDENMDALGEKLALPPFLESRRAEIEAGLRPL